MKAKDGIAGLPLAALVAEIERREAAEREAAAKRQRAREKAAAERSYSPQVYERQVATAARTGSLALLRAQLRTGQHDITDRALWQQRCREAGLTA